MKIRIFLIATVFLCMWQSHAREMVGNVRKSFSITVQGLRKDMNYIQKRSELQMARNTDFCRGAMMPASSQSWSCKGVGPGINKCELKYRCRRISKQFNRVSESKRLRSDLKGLKKPDAKFKIWVSAKPVRNLGRYRTAKGNVLSPKPAEKRIARAKPKKVSKKKLNEVIEKDDFDELEDFEDEIDERDLDEDEEELAGLKEDDLDEELDEEDLDELREDEDEPKNWRVEKKRTTDGDEEEYRIIKKSRRLSKDERSSFQWLSFAGSFLRVSDALDNSLAAFDLAWTPHYRFSENWEAKGILGGHFFTLASNDPTVEDETFLVYDIGVGLIYRFGRFYIEGTIGTQSWGNTLGDSLTTVGFGAGYKFKSYKLKYVDRVFFSMTSASNEIRDNSELRIGLGISF